jgi:tetratricopeptide (TPR) repeat protein
MNRLSRARLVAAVLVAFAAHGVSAEALLKPVPTPKLDGLPADVQQQLTTARSNFEQQKVNLIGEDLSSAYVRLGALYARYKLWDAAKAAIANAVAMAPDDGRFQYLAGFFAEQSGDLETAKVTYEKARALEDNYLPIHYRLAALYLGANQLPQAKTVLDSILKDNPDAVPALAASAEVALRQKRYADAVTGFKRALQLDPSATALNQGLADAYAGAGDAAKASAARAAIGTGQPGYADPLVAGIYAKPPEDPITSALQLAGEGSYDVARGMLDELLKKDPKSVDAHAAYARIDADAGRLASAGQHAQAALAAAPESATALLAAGLVREASGDDVQAQSFYERAVKADGKSPDARIALGNTYLRIKQYPLALEQFRQLNVLTDNANEALMRYTGAAVAAGRCGDALALVEQTRKTRGSDGVLAQTWARIASSCPIANAAARSAALTTAKSLYDQRPTASHAETYAMALAANGKATDAVDYEAQAIFESVKDKDQAAVDRRKIWMNTFKSGKAVDTPWPPGHPLQNPPALRPSVNDGK